ncbi:alginate export family protein [Zhouia spongiae]|uniref:Alginate export family protein n=1 Tax=Zhouia spongiae TaxID=2202721 RepID=A0ABY3YMF2_9FLAO|nr:alginate export family protein [Zhouia spongiae]UNY98800.1 alginate export family protein [Zhouia spongiae]
MRLLTTTLLICLFCQVLSAQEFKADLQLRPRFEYRNGFKTLLDDHQGSASLVSQRSRLNFGFKQEQIELKLSLQNIRVWGDVPTLTSTDKNNVMIYEAYGVYNLNDQWSFKLGRQQLSYDNQRILGAVDWAQQGRSHDAFLTTFKPNEKSRLDFAISVSSEAEVLAETPYTLNNFKNMQFLWYHINFNASQLSLLALNTGFEFEDSVTGDLNTQYMQTIGGFYKFKHNSWYGDLGAYGQFGERNDSDVSAWNFSANVYFNISDSWTTGIGGEYLSGTDMGETSGDVNAFNPLFGTNHAFNGFMDYFYVGNHINSVGLTDVYAKIFYKKDKFNVSVQPHLFWSAANMMNGASEADKYLGTEIDVAANYKIHKNIGLAMGYSQMFGTDSMEILKGGDSGNTQNWAWISVNFNPAIFNSKKK